MKRLTIGLLLAFLMLSWTVDVSSQQGSVRLPCITNEPRLPDGTEVDCDLPAVRHMKNVGGSDGAGLCVGTANQNMFDWHHVVGYCDLKNGYQSYLRKFPGGSWKDKASQQIAEYAKTHPGVIAPEILHDTSGDIELQVHALKNGYIPSVRILRSPAGRYSGQSIDHMVILVGARCGPTKAWCMIDNNFPGTWEWFSEADWKRTYGKWSMYVLDHPAPPPIPSPNK